jgi:hypothetical protein
LPSVTNARSSFAHDPDADESESDEEHPESVNAAAITTTENIQLFFLNKLNSIS